nr:MAG TPA: hypothetical protein [Caudoviricetes sp.]
MTSSPFGFCFTTSQFSGASPACPSLIFCARVGFFPCLKELPPFFLGEDVIE